MLINWHRIFWTSGVPFVLFCLLLFISHFIYSRFLRHQKPTLLNAAIVMALTILAITALPNYDLPALVMLAITLESYIIWFYCGFLQIQSYIFEDVHHKPIFTDLALGTWSASAALLAALLDQMQPSLHGSIVLMGLLAIILWLLFLFVNALWLIELVKKGLVQESVDGMVFLPAINIQCIVILIDRLFGNDLADWFYQDLIVFGYLLYFAGLALWVWYLVKYDRLLSKWSAANSFFYSAMALNGIAVMNLNTEIPLWILHLTWWWSVVGFILIVGIEIYLWMRQAQSPELRKNLFSYDTSQWLRLFSLTTFYTFAWFYYHQHYTESTILGFVAYEGHYILTAFYFLEGLILLKYLKSSSLNTHRTS